MADYAVMRAAEAPDYTGEAPGAFLGYGHSLGAEQIAVNLRVLEPHTAHVAPGGEPADDCRRRVELNRRSFPTERQGVDREW